MNGDVYKRQVCRRHRYGKIPGAVNHICHSRSNHLLLPADHGAVRQCCLLYTSYQRDRYSESTGLFPEGYPVGVFIGGKLYQSAG